MPGEQRSPVHVAFRTWDAASEPLESVEARIHDGVPLDQLRARAAGYLEIFHRPYPHARVARQPEVMEIGSGVGYVMEAALHRYRPSRIVGLDVAAGMIQKARERLRRDGVDHPGIGFAHYDGVHAPFPDDSFDLIYSVASLQHAPRPYCFRALMEAYRMVRPGGTVFIHLLACSHFRRHMTPELFRAEIDRQIAMREGHWHHYYSADELDAVARQGLGIRSPGIRELGGSLYLYFSK